MELIHKIKVDLSELENKIQKDILDFINKTGLKPQIDINFNEVFECGKKNPIITHVEVNATVSVSSKL